MKSKLQLSLPQCLWLGVLFLGICHGMVLLSIYVLGHDYARGFVPLFHLDLEKNVPSTYSTMLFLLNSILFFKLAFSGFDRKVDSRVWILVSSVLLFLSFDEFFAIHEKLSKPVRDYFAEYSVTYAAWLIPYSLIFLTLAFLCIPALLRLPPQYRNRLIFGGLVFCSGAVGLELLASTEIAFALSQGTGAHDALETFKPIMYCFVEEMLELSGLVISATAVLGLLKVKALGPISNSDLETQAPQVIEAKAPQVVNS